MLLSLFSWIILTNRAYSSFPSVYFPLSPPHPSRTSSVCVGVSLSFFGSVGHHPNRHLLTCLLQHVRCSALHTAQAQLCIIDEYYTLLYTMKKEDNGNYYAG